MLNAKYELRNIYDKIQKQLFYMIPEKWDKLYLYASVLEHYNNVQTGEMFFYYYPKGILKKNPVSVYEVPGKFNIDEKSYLKLAENLYNSIKELRTYLIEDGEKPWTNLTISIEDFKFNVEFNYENLVNSIYTNQDRHLIWSYKYLDLPLSSIPKENRAKVKRYLEEEEFHKRNNTTYCEGIYEKPISNLIKYNKEENIDNSEKNENVGGACYATQENNKLEMTNKKHEELPYSKEMPVRHDTTVSKKKKEIKKEPEEEPQITSQILMCK